MIKIKPMEALRKTHEEILRLSKIANQSDEEIRKYPSTIRGILFIRRQYALSFVTTKVNSVMSNVEFMDKSTKIEYCDNQLKQILAIK